jgi:hypothetical protein
MELRRHFSSSRIVIVRATTQVRSLKLVSEAIALTVHSLHPERAIAFWLKLGFYTVTTRYLRCYILNKQFYKGKALSQWFIRALTSDSNI